MVSKEIKSTGSSPAREMDLSVPTGTPAYDTIKTPIQFSYIHSRPAKVVMYILLGLAYLHHHLSTLFLLTIINLNKYLQFG